MPYDVIIMFSHCLLGSSLHRSQPNSSTRRLTSSAEGERAPLPPVPLMADASFDAANLARANVTEFARQLAIRGTYTALTHTSPGHASSAVAYLFACCLRFGHLLLHVGLHLCVCARVRLRADFRLFQAINYSEFLDSKMHTADSAPNLFRMLDSLGQASALLLFSSLTSRHTCHCIVFKTCETRAPF